MLQALHPIDSRPSDSAPLTAWSVAATTALSVAALGCWYWYVALAA